MDYQPCRIGSTALVAIAILGGCASASPRETSRSKSGDSTHSFTPNKDKASQPPKDSRASASAAGDFREIQALYRESRTVEQYDRLLARINSFEIKFPRNALLPQAYNLKGMAHLLARRPELASVWFERALDLKSEEDSGETPLRPYLLYNLASARFDAQKLEEAERAFATIELSALQGENRSKALALGSRLALKLGKAELALERFVDLDSLVLDQAEAAVSGPKPGQLPSPDRFAHLTLAEQALDEIRSVDTLKRLEERSRPGALKRLIAEKRAALESAAISPVASATIGVLLPMSGKFARFGSRALQGIELALGIFGSPGVSESPQQAAGLSNKIALVIEDSGETAESAAQALERLALKHRVGMVIGPLLSKGIESIARRADELRVPVLSLAQQPASGEFFFTAAVTPQEQARALARFAIEEKGLRRFAILHPKSKFGEQYAQTFWDAVEELGGTIRGIESYEPEETDFRSVVGRLSGLHLPEARGRELAELARAREEQKIRKRNRKTEQFYALPPVVDFDAVFIPDEPKAIGQILPTFAYRDIRSMRFLGPSTWHSPELIERAQSHSEGALFVDSYAPEAPSRQLARFLENYRTTFSQEPGPIEAAAYDAGLIAFQALTPDPGASRQALREELRETRGLEGATGALSQENGNFTRALRLLTVRAGAITSP